MDNKKLELTMIAKDIAIVTIFIIFIKIIKANIALSFILCILFNILLNLKIIDKYR